MKQQSGLILLTVFLFFALAGSIYLSWLKTNLIKTQSKYTDQLEKYIGYWYNKTDSLVRENSALKLYIIENKQ